jgi:hypothetical protein
MELKNSHEWKVIFVQLAFCGLRRLYFTGILRAYDSKPFICSVICFTRLSYVHIIKHVLIMAYLEEAI